MTSILSSASGYMAVSYDYTITPYTGCSFGCSYCYVPTIFYFRKQAASWGQGVRPKRDAVELLAREARAGRIAGRRIYLSPNTDPYVPEERAEQITRGLLEIMCEYPPELLVIQTRSPFVLRDLDLLKQLGNRIVLGITISTDDDSVRRCFEPRCPSIQKRVQTLAALHAAGIRTQASLAPLLPCDPIKLAGLVDGHADWIVVQALKQGGTGARTWKPALEILQANGLTRWLQTGDAVQQAMAVLRAYFGPRYHEGQDGFGLRFLTGRLGDKHDVKGGQRRHDAAPADSSADRPLWTRG